MFSYDMYVQFTFLIFMVHLVMSSVMTGLTRPDLTNCIPNDLFSYRAKSSASSSLQ